MHGQLDEDDERRIGALCKELRGILDAELLAGNEVVETWEDWGFVVLLSRPFTRSHDTASGVLEYREKDDPHYWKAQYHCPSSGQTLACRF